MTGTEIGCNAVKPLFSLRRKLLNKPCKLIVETCPNNGYIIDIFGYKMTQCNGISKSLSGIRKQFFESEKIKLAGFFFSVN